MWPGTSGFSFNGSGPLAGQTYGDLFDCNGPCAAITRQSNLSIQNKYMSAYLQDTVTFDRLTMNLGVRWDQQFGDNNPTTILGNPTPEFAAAAILPTVNYPAPTVHSPGPTGSRAPA